VRELFEQLLQFVTTLQQQTFVQVLQVHVSFFLSLPLSLDSWRTEIKQQHNEKREKIDGGVMNCIS